MEPLQLVEVGHKRTALTVSGEPAQALLKEEPMFGIPSSSWIAIVQALA